MHDAKSTPELLERTPCREAVRHVRHVRAGACTSPGVAACGTVGREGGGKGDACRHSHARPPRDCARCARRLSRRPRAGG